MPQEYKVTCPDCGTPMSLRTARFSVFYKCDTVGCTMTQGANSKTHEPTGTPSNMALKQLRISAKDHFDLLWMGGPINISKDDAFDWVRKVLQLSSDVHFNVFNEEQCQKVVSGVRSLFKKGGFPVVLERVRLKYQPGYSSAKREFLSTQKVYKSYSPGTAPVTVITRYKDAKNLLHKMQKEPLYRSEAMNTNLNNIYGRGMS